MADPGLGEPLIGWKAIAAHFRRDQRTVMRWAATRGLPVKRVPGAGRSTVFADASALDAWLSASADAPDPAIDKVATPAQNLPPRKPIVRSRRRWITLGAAALLAILCLVWQFVPDRQGDAAPIVALPVDPAARAAFLQASYDWNQRTAESLSRAITGFGVAIAHDPAFEPSYAGLASAYLLIREFGALPDEQAYPKAQAAAEAAIALDPNDPAAHRALAFVAFWWQADRPKATKEFARAIGLAPRDALSHHWLATALSANGEPGAALREMTIARSLAPESTATLVDYLLLRYLARHDRADVAALRNLKATAPNLASVPYALAMIALYEGRPADYLAEAMQAARLREDAAERDRITRQQAAFRAGGRAALDAVMIAQARAASGPDRDFALARILSVTGNGPDALVLVTRVCRNREVGASVASGDLWMTRSVPPADIRSLCEAGSLDA